MVWFGDRRGLDSPPEAAIEATPENTPFATPVKDERLWQAGLRIRIRIQSGQWIRFRDLDPGGQK
jgi:hypothetical protein